MKTSQLDRATLMKIGWHLRRSYEACTVEPNPRLDALALIADAKLREDPYIKGATFKGRPL